MKERRYAAAIVLALLALCMGAAVTRIDFTPLAPVRVIYANGTVVGYGYGSATDVARGTALYNAVVAATASASVETVEIGAGTFDLGSTNKLQLGDGDALKGLGCNASTIKSTLQWNTGGAIINPGANNYVGQFTIDTTGFDESGGQTCVAIGSLNLTGTYTSDHKFTGLVVEGVKFSTDIDSFVVTHSDASTASYGATFRDCGFVGAWDHFAVTASNGTATGNFDFYNCDFTTTGTLITTPTTDARVAVMAGLSAGGLKGRFYSCNFTTSGGTTSNVSVNTTGAGVIELYSPRISTTGTSATDLVRSSISTLKVVGGTGSGTGGIFTTSGTITRSSDLLAGTTPTAAGLTLIDDADASAQRTTLGLAIGTNVQAYDADLTTYAGITPSANVQSLLGAANHAAVRTLLGIATTDSPVFGSGGAIYTSQIATGSSPGTGNRSCLVSHNGGGGQTLIGTSGFFGLCASGADAFEPNLTVRLWYDAAGILAQRNSTNAQSSRIYETYTDSSNYERFSITTGSDATSLVNQSAGTGTSARTLKLTASGTASVEVTTPLSVGAASTLTIATGVITATKSYHKVETESAAASDDLDTINGGVEGDTLTLRATDTTHTVVVKDGTGNLQCAGDCTLDNSQDTITLIFDGTNWLETARSNNGT